MSIFSFKNLQCYRDESLGTILPVPVSPPEVPPSGSCPRRPFLGIYIKIYPYKAFVWVCFLPYTNGIILYISLCSILFITRKKKPQ